MAIFVKGGIVMYPLLLCSLTALAVIIERAVFFFRVSREEREFSRWSGNLHRRLGEGDRDGALALLKAQGGGHMSRVLAAGLCASGQEGARREMQAAGELERKKIFAGLPILDTIVTAAPLLGLLGTVTGILHTFNVLGGQPAVGNMQAVGRGIAEALITTAGGLIIAVPSLIALNYFAYRAESTQAALEREIDGFLEWGDDRGRDA